MCHNKSFKVCSGRNSQIKKQLCDFKIVGDLLLRSMVKSIKKIVWDFKKSGSLYVWELDMNRPLLFFVGCDELVTDAFSDNFLKKPILHVRAGS